MLKWSLTTVVAFVTITVVISFVRPIELGGVGRDRFELAWGEIARARTSRSGGCIGISGIVPLWLVLPPLAIPVIWLWRKDPTLRGHCPICSYNLTANVSARCSECGEPVRSDSGTLTPVGRTKNAESHG